MKSLDRHRWAFANGVSVKTSAELGFRYTLTKKENLGKDEKSFNFHGGLNLIDVGYSF